MEKVSALQVGNHLGEILDRLERTCAPILIGKGRKVRSAHHPRAVSAKVY